MNRVTDPVNSGIAFDLSNEYYQNNQNNTVNNKAITYSLVAWVYQDNFEVFVDTILVNPVGIQDTQITTATADTFFSSALQAALVLEMVNTLTDGFTVGSTCSHESWVTDFGEKSVSIV